jgi:hypothetical protein
MGIFSVCNSYAQHWGIWEKEELLLSETYNRHKLQNMKTSGERTNKHSGCFKKDAITSGGETGHAEEPGLSLGDNFSFPALVVTFASMCCVPRINHED